MMQSISTMARDAATTSGKVGRPKGQRGGPYRDLGDGASAAAKRVAAAVLEVLAGARTPTEAAQALDLSLPRYYLLESRAMHGLLAACEPRSAERGPSPESALAALRRECERLRRECTRQQTLVRAAQRTIGLTPRAPARAERNGKTQRRRRRPTARALKAAARLMEKPAEPVVAVTTAPATTG